MLRQMKGEAPPEEEKPEEEEEKVEEVEEFEDPVTPGNHHMLLFDICLLTQGLLVLQCVCVFLLHMYCIQL